MEIAHLGPAAIEDCEPECCVQRHGFISKTADNCVTLRSRSQGTNLRSHESEKGRPEKVKSSVLLLITL